VKRLIVNADDFGLTPGVSDGIAEAHRRGIVTSTSLMASGSAFDHAVELARELPELSVGVHLTLVEERPVSSPDSIPSLVTAQGVFHASHREFLLRYIRGTIAPADIETELRAQVARCASSGIPITHLDSHQHLHALPGIMRIVMKIAGEYGIRGIRAPHDCPRRRGAMLPAGLAAKSGLCLLAYWTSRNVRAPFAHSPDRMIGVFDSGSLTENRLLRMLRFVNQGTTELLCHPGRQDHYARQRYGHWRFDWEAELSALTSPRVMDALDSHEIRKISYNEI
jgi:hopanoid biosynthesis associated protein HpnK